MIRLVAVCLVALVFFLCNGPDENKDCSTLADPQRGIELVYPRGLESFERGTDVMVRWKVDPRIIGQVTLRVSANGVDGPWRNICRAIDVPSGDAIICMDTVWSIGNEYEPVSYTASGTVNIQVGWYNHENDYSDMSGAIIIN